VDVFFFQVEDPLLEATKYLKLLQKHSLNSLETHLLSFEVNMRKKKILLALQVFIVRNVELGHHCQPFSLSCVTIHDVYLIDCQGNTGKHSVI